MKQNIYLLLLLSAAACGDEQDAAYELNGDEFVHHDLGYTLNLPSSWAHSLGEQVGQLELDVVSRSPTQGGFAANLFAGSAPYFGPADMAEALEEQKELMLEQAPGIRFEAESVDLVDGVSVGKLTSAFDFAGRELTVRDLLFIRFDQGVQVSMTDLTERFAENSEFEDVEASLAFLNE